jgi:hypothetical protein
MAIAAASPAITPPMMLTRRFRQTILRGYLKSERSDFGEVFELCSQAGRGEASSRQRKRSKHKPRNRVNVAETGRQSILERV